MLIRQANYSRRQNGANHDRWLISYTDVVTILLILFVAVAAQGLKARVAPAPPPPTAAPVVPKRAALLQAERKLKPQGIDVKLESRGLVISLLQSILFAPGDDRINTEATPSLSRIADVLRTNRNKIVLVGHADTTPIHNRRFRDNWQLSAARSLSLLELLTSRYGIPESRLSIESFGSNHPLSPNDTVEGRAANRRVEILILDDPVSP
ncbi:MAG TPA: OmpA family protein [Bryobacteraceae bacterium]|nr:OmpA family protein [Bryobacteraceae bacterium]